ncbi:NlpC/P60 family protein [Paenibacillaceae bacterium GAS479]|nr:NlpC/P60 family protein [Paenibacillaceae bacterium GAS479]
MKKAFLSFVALIMLLTFSTSAFASTPDLDSAIKKVIGTPYKYGGTTTAGFDCSGFVRHIFNQFDVKLPRTSKTQAKIGTKVDKSDLRPGDLVFFNTSGKGISHAGIYVGDGKFAHASSKGVRYTELSDSYYAKRYVTARRVVTGEDYMAMVGEEDEGEDVAGE